MIGFENWEFCNAVMVVHRGVWIFVERRDDKIADESVELITLGRKLADKLGTELSTILFGNRNVERLAKELIRYGVDEVYICRDERLNTYQSEAYSSIIASLVNQYSPEILLISATSVGRDLAPTVAAKLNTGLTADCIDLEINEKQQLVQVVPAFMGNILAKVICPKHMPQMATVRPGIFKKPEKNMSKSGEIIEVDIDFKRLYYMKVVEIHKETHARPLDIADIVVCAGRGVSKSGSIEIAKQLTDVLGGAVGITDPVLNDGLGSSDQLIGQSGKVVKPKLYIALGVSGALQHIVGILDSKIIVAVNNDPEASIFRIANFGIIGDLFKVTPCLIEEFKKLKGKSS